MTKFNIEITEMNNFCRVFEMPESFPEDFCFGGGHDVVFKIVDWFNPMPNPAFMPETKDWKWEDAVPMIVDFMQKKKYVKAGRKYILVTDFGESLVIEKAKP